MQDQTQRVTQATKAQHAYERAGARYEEQMTSEEYQRFSEISTLSLAYLVKQSQAMCQALQHGQVASTGRSTSIFETKVSKLALDRVLEGVCKLSPVAGELIWGSVSFILEIARENANLLEEVLEFLVGMSDEVEHLQMVENSFHGSIIVISAVEAVYIALINFWAKAMEYYRNKMKSDIVSRIKIWLSSSSKMSVAFGKLKAEIAAQTRRLHNVESTQYYTDDQIERVQRRQKELSEWIDAPRYESDHNVAVEHCYDGTCEWLREKQEYRDWVKGRSNGLLIIYGTAGIGKTILSSWLIDEMQFCGSGTQSKHLALYHYFKETDETKNTPLAALRSLLDQIYDHLLSSNHPLTTSLESDLQGVSRKKHIEFEQLWTIVSSLLSQYCQLDQRLTIVLDAMDECKESKKLVQSLRMTVHLHK